MGSEVSFNIQFSLCVFEFKLECHCVLCGQKYTLKLSNEIRFDLSFAFLLITVSTRNYQKEKFLEIYQVMILKCYVIHFFLFQKAAQVDGWFVYFAR